MAKKILITIGRQFGSGGKAVAHILGHKLGIPVYDNELIDEAAKKSGFSKDLFEGSDEKKRPFSLSSIFSSNRYGHFSDNYINDADLFRIQSETIRSLAEKGSAIFVGRASDFVLRDMNCIDVFLTAPLEVRKRFVSQREGISPEEAEEMILKREKEREAYYNYLTFGNWGVASNYDLCIDSSILGFEGTADLIIEYARKRGYLTDGEA
jgi:cytidylate kinase